MNFSQGHSGTKVQCEPCLFSYGKTPEFTKMGEIHELFVLTLSLVWFAGATPETRCTPIRVWKHHAPDMRLQNYNVPSGSLKPEAPSGLKRGFSDKFQTLDNLPKEHSTMPIWATCHPTAKRGKTNGYRQKIRESLDTLKLLRQSCLCDQGALIDASL